MLLKDILFPKICLGCGFLGSYICPKCLKKFSYVEKDVCLYCNKGSFFGLTHIGCQKKYGIDGFISIYHYNNTLKKVIKNIKYRLVQEAMGDFLKAISFKVLADKLKFFKNKNLLFNPIPLHPKRLKSRGFNQSEALVNFFTDFFSTEAIQLFDRIKDTKSQAILKKRKERDLNIKQAFAVKKGAQIAGKQIVLIDDLVTSGATVKEAAYVLKKGGADTVYTLALAKG